jgi:all-trans-retinol 13,14-reductase
LDIDTQTFLESITSNRKLQNVLAGTSLLYAGTIYKTPFYIHALVVNSYIESSWRFMDGGSQIARALAREITSRGGVVHKRTKVVKLVEQGGSLQYAETDCGEKYYGKIFISNVHPSKTMEMTDSSLIKKAFRNRIRSLENSISFFSVNIVLKQNSWPYFNHNYYYFNQDDAWGVADYTEEDWPRGYALYSSASSKASTFADGVTIMTYMRFEDMKKWEHTFNTATHESPRGADYEQFKKMKAEKLISQVELRFPGFREAIDRYYVATPLSARDYIGTDDGTLYGVVKDYREPMRTFISPRTKIPNLYLTGQNLNLHGILGVAFSSIVTCSEILGKDYILEKIRTA